jgi:hypothetical protein
MSCTGVEVVPFPRPDESAANASHCPLASKAAATEARRALLARSCQRAARWAGMKAEAGARAGSAREAAA